MDPSSGQIITTSKPLSDNGELDLTFDEWHQAWRRLLDLIKTHVAAEFHLWDTHYNFILDNDNRAELWPLYVAYDVEIRRRAVVSAIDPSVFSIGIWNDLEARYMAKKVLSLVQSDLKHNTPSSKNRITLVPTAGLFVTRRIPGSVDSSKSGRCIFCGNRSKDHPSKNCLVSSTLMGHLALCKDKNPPALDRTNQGNALFFLERLCRL
jgi:hypothetical protein